MVVATKTLLSTRVRWMEVNYLSLSVLRPQKEGWYDPVDRGGTLPHREPHRIFLRQRTTSGTKLTKWVIATTLNSLTHLTTALTHAQ